MKLWKKVSAMAAMAAVCITMAVPAVASAETNARIGGCAHNEWSETQIRYEVVSTSSHIYEGNDKCEIQELKVVEYKYCNDCGIIQTIGHTYTTKHTKCGL